MKKKSLLSKLAIGLFALVGVFAISSCERADHSARTPIEQSAVAILENPTTHEKYATVQVGIENPTIYNVIEITFDYECFDASGTSLHEFTDVAVNCYVRHGVAGYMTYVVNHVEQGPYPTTTKVVVNDVRVTKYTTLWETYMAPFIFAIIVLCLELLFFGIELFRKGWTKESAAEYFREKLASMGVMLALVLIICLIPLMFANWVVTCILFGTFASMVLLDGVMTLIKMATLKNK